MNDKPTNPDGRNIIDYYHYWTHEAILADLDSKRHNFSILIANKINDFNLSTVVRNCNAFLGTNIYIYGNRHWDRRGAVGMHRYEHIQRLKEIDDLAFLRDREKYHVIGVDNIPEAKPIENYSWDRNRHTIMVFGQETQGICSELAEICEDFIYIAQYGCVRSLNVGCASAISMFAYTSKVHFPPNI